MKAQKMAVADPNASGQCTLDAALRRRFSDGSALNDRIQANWKAAATGCLWPIVAGHART
jgi:hypothetical protein